MAELGYPMQRLDQHVKLGLSRAEKFESPIMRLAHTAALEHYTAALAECLLRKPEAQALLGTGPAREVLLWHALEESEHKSVAFDVFRQVGGSERQRIWMMRWATFALFSYVVIGSSLSMLFTDKSARNPIKLSKSLLRLRKSPFLAKDVREQLRAYNRKGFHPDDFDCTELITSWNARLFGA